MAYVSVPADLGRVRSKIMFGLTLRQLACFGSGAAIGLPLYFGLKAGLKCNSSLSAMAMVLIMLPFFLLAIYEKNGQPLEKAAANIIRVIFIRPKRRPYKIDNFYSLLGRQNTLEKEVAHIVANSQKNRELLLPPVWDGRQAKRCGVGDKDGKKRRKKAKAKKAVKCR